MRIILYSLISLLLMINFCFAGDTTITAITGDSGSDNVDINLKTGKIIDNNVKTI